MIQYFSLSEQFYNQASSQQHTGVVNSRMQPSLQQQHQQQQASSSRQQLSQQAPQLTQQQDLATSRPKRYSSLRQRPSMPEGPTTSGQPNYPPAPPQHAYYPAPPAQGKNKNNNLCKKNISDVIENQHRVKKFYALKAQT